MRFTALLLPIVLPVLFWSGYHYYKDRHLPEPPGHLALAFLLGVGAFFLGILGYRGLGLLGLQFDPYALAASNPPGLYAYAILVIGLLEELVKLVPFLLVVLRFREFDEPIDGIIYASFIALGFAAVENYHYLQYVSDLVAIGRGFAGPVVHIAFASIWGYYVGTAHLCGRPLLGPVLLSLGATAVLHGSYDFAVIANPGVALPGAAMLIGLLWIWRLRLMNRLSEQPTGPCPQDSDKN